MLIVDKQDEIVKTSENDFLNEIKETIKGKSSNLRVRTNVKFIIAGQGAVGKTTLVQRYLGRPFHAQYLVTLGVQTSVVSVNLEPLVGIQKTVKLQLWDLAGQPQFREVLRPFFAGTDEAIFVVDLSRLSTFETIIDWIKETNKHNMKKTPFVIIGSKYDLIGNSATSLESVIKEYLLQIKEVTKDPFRDELLFLETSSKNDLNISEAFEIALLRDILLTNR